MAGNYRISHTYRPVTWKTSGIFTEVTVARRRCRPGTCMEPHSEAGFTGGGAPGAGLQEEPTAILTTGRPLPSSWPPSQAWGSHDPAGDGKD